MPGRGPIRGKKRASSAPPLRPANGETSDGVPAMLEGEFVQLPSGKHYDSADSDDGPTGEVLEDADLI